MRRHWQRRPLLVRGAVPGFVAPIAPARLFALAARDDVESRLVSRDAGRWRLEHGPFARLPSGRRGQWTVLVQGVDLHDDAVHALLRRFRFVPDARLDDAMVSFATDGGGVGPHVDSYDVFLLQAHGRRRWRIAPPGDASIVPGMPVRLLRRFAPTEDWLLEPGDMLYLPPGWGHDGVADGECMTISIGFRAPSRHEFLSAFLADSSDRVGGADPRFGDAGRRPCRRPAHLPDDLAARLHDWATGWRPRRAEVDRFIGRFLTEPKPSVWFERPAALPASRFAAAAGRQGVVLDRRTRIAWRRASVFVNGEEEQPSPGCRRWLRRLADRRTLDAAECLRALAVPGLAAILHRWRAAGWLSLASPRP